MMLKNKSSIFIILILAMFSLGVEARLSELQGSPLQPVEWQAIKLQENIEGKIIRSLNPIIKESEYVIEVKIGVDLDNAEDPSSKKITRTEQKKKVRFSTAIAPKEGDDFVVFNKLGLEAPMIGEEGVETTTSEVELAQKAIIEMNDRYNLFNFLNGIDIKLTFDKGLTVKSRESIQKIINGLSFNTKEIIPQINIQYLDLKDSRVKTADELKAMAAAGAGGAGGGKLDGKLESLNKANRITWDERFKNLDIMLGIIVGAIVLGLAAIFIAKKGSKHEGTQELKNENKNEGTSTNKNENENENENDNNNESENGELLEDGDDMNFDLTKTDPQTVRIVAGLERFRKMMSLHFNDMVLMVKGWIKVGKGPEAMALKGLVATLSDSELAEIFKAFTIDERNSWKLCLDSEMNKDDLAKAFTIISNKVIEAMLVPSLIDDYEICDLLLALSAEDASRFCMQHPELGIIFANVLSAKTIGDMFTLMPVDLTADIIEKSSMFRKEEIVAQMPLLKEKLLEVKISRERPPFLARIFDILPTARPEIEKQLYSTLIKHCSWADVKATALSVLPGELAGNLPESVFRGIINLMPLETQVQYFAVQDDDQREESLDRFAAKGSKNREMVEIEVNAIAANEMALKRLKLDRKSSIESDFLSLARNYISSSTEAQVEMRAEIETWLKNIENKMASKSKVDLEAA
jgi:gas vesicle protein